MRQRVGAAALVVLALVTGGFGLASVDRCGTWARAAPQLVSVGKADGVLKVGVGRQVIAIDYPATVAGYGPPRPTASSGAPLSARATSLEVGGTFFSLVTVETLLVPAAVQLAVQAGVAGRVWVVATHAHTSFGGYDHRLAVQLGALGRATARDEAALIAAARQAVEQSRRVMVEARLEVAEGSLDGLAIPRSGEAVDSRLTVLRFVGERPLAQWIIAAAHPTINAPNASVLDGDWPGHLAALEEANGGPTTLVLQGAGGNATADRARAGTAEAFAQAMVALLRALTYAPHPHTLSWSEVGIALPRPEATRLVPSVVRPVVENTLCEGSEHDALVGLLRLGTTSLLFTTLEPTATSGPFLENQADATRVVGLANGYHGYVELSETVRANTGEAKRQYFPDTLANVVGDGARLARELVQQP